VDLVDEIVREQRLDQVRAPVYLDLRPVLLFQRGDLRNDVTTQYSPIESSQ